MTPAIAPAKPKKAPNKRGMFRHDKPMEELGQRVAVAYEKLLDKLYRELLTYLGKEVVPGVKLTKSANKDDEGHYGFVADVDWPDDEMVAFASQDDSDSPFSPKRFMVEKKLSLLTPRQFAEVKRIVRDYHLAFAVGMFGADAIPPHEVQRLMDIGILPQDLAYVFQPAPGELPPPAERITDLAFQYGQQLAQPEQTDAVREMTVDDFTEHLEATRSELNPVERQAMAFARFNAGELVTGMGDRVSLEVGSIIRDADAEQRRRYLGTIRKELEDNIDKRGSWRQLASAIGHATEDWSRDMQRLAKTEKQFAMQEGQAREMAKRGDPDDIRVAKQPNPDACPDCIRLHLTAGPGSPPRIFKLSELTANGTNVGLKRKDWKAVVGPVHPYCGCELIEVPDGWAFDEEGDLVPEVLLKKGDRLGHSLELVKSQSPRPHMTHREAVPDDTLVVRVADPTIRQVVEAVLSEAPPEIFRRKVGVTLITTDSPRAQNPLDDHDFAYWTANEIRLNQTLPVERIPRVLRHELGHSLNVWLMNKLGSVEAVREWHKDLWAVSEQEGFVSSYAEKAPIENAAEATREYLFERARLMLGYPRTFAFLHRWYREIFE